MKKILQKIGVLVSLAGLVGIFPGFGQAELQKHSLKRTEDHVAFTGELVPALLGGEVRDLHLYAGGASGFKAIPFQVDKRDAEGRYVFPDEKLRDPARDGSRLDANDELVFMIKDAGGKCAPKDWLEGAAAGVELELVDPLDQGRAWVYLFQRSGAEPPRTEDYVRYREEGGRRYVFSDQYEVGRALTEPYYTSLRLRQPNGGFSPDLLDRVRTNLRARLLNGAIPVHVPEQEAKYASLGMIDGPVRVIRDELFLMRLKAIGLDWSTEVFYTYYFNGQLNPIEANIPVNINKVFLDFSFLWALDWNENVLGSTYLNSANPKGILLDGKPDPGMDTEQDSPYFIVTGPQGGLVEVVTLDGNIASYVRRVTLVRENLDKPLPPEDHPGQLLTGFLIKASDRWPKGTYHLRLFQYYPYPFSEQKAHQILNMIEQPVQVFARPLSPSAGVAP